MSEADLNINHFVENEDIDTLSRLLMTEPERVNERFVDALTPLHTAVQTGNRRLVEHLLGYHPEINAQDADGITPLHLAARLGLLDIAQLLLQNGALVNAATHSGKTPLDFAEEVSYDANRQVAYLFRSHGACCSRR